MTYFYRDEVYDLSDGTPSAVRRKRYRYRPFLLRWVSGVLSRSFSPWAKLSYVAELVVDRPSDTSRVWKAIASTASANRPPDSDASNTHWEFIYKAKDDREIRSGVVADGLWDQRPDDESEDNTYLWDETVALVEMKHANLMNSWLWVYARCEVK